MSTHEIPVVRLGPIIKHPNADTLGITSIFGWSCCVKLGDFNEGDLCVYIPPDYVCPDTPQFEFLGEHKRIKVRRLRGVISQGLLLSAPDNVKEGDDVIDLLGIKRYEPPISAHTGGENVKIPPVYSPVYDIESFQKYHTVLIPGERVIISEKIHGANSRLTFTNGQMYAGSHNYWKMEDEKNLWWACLKQNPWIEDFCRRNENLVVYGEVFGQVQDLRYGSNQGQYFFAVFDILDKNKWWDYIKLIESGIPTVPILYDGPWDEQLARSLARGNSTWPNAKHMREGIVIRTEPLRFDLTLGRVVLKIINDDYLMRK